MEIDYVRVYQETPTVSNQINLTMFIQGYYLNNNVMRSVKINQEDPDVSPANEVEDITVELHNATFPYALVATANTTLKTNGNAVCNFPTAPSGNYYVVVKTRNAIETWSNTPQTIGAVPLNYSFATNASKAYGNNMNLVAANTWSFYSGDVNDDQNIDLIDLAIVQTDINNFLYGSLATDINGDGNVDLLDATNVENNVNAFVFANLP